MAGVLMFDLVSFISCRKLIRHVCSKTGTNLSKKFVNRKLVNKETIIFKK
jgi:hypothetical protein